MSPSISPGTATPRLRAGLLALLLLASMPLRAQSADMERVSVPRFTHPGSGQVFYFLLTDRFSNGSAANDTGGITGGPDASGFDPARISFYHGGDLIGLTQKLDYIKALGATAVWITPVFTNKPVQGGTAGYHGYWILDFTRIDPHLGTEADFRAFVAQAHARGLRVYLDIIVNHTADVIKYRDGGDGYITQEVAPYRDADGRPFDPHAVAYNGVNAPGDFPRLSAERSFAHVPVVSPAESHAKAPEWLNDVTLYHNRGNSTFRGDSALDGDFSGLDDVFTENPAVVRGFIEVYSRWMERYGIDGYRIDTVKHVNLEFWQAFAPALRQKARELGRPDFLQFGEVNCGNKDAMLMSEFTTEGALDATLDFDFAEAARGFIAGGGDAAELGEVFARDAWYTDHDSNAQSTTTFVSNHDNGRLGYFVQQGNPLASPGQRAGLALLGQELLLTVRGQPVVYYGDEQGMVGLGGDSGAREDMFASEVPQYRGLALMGTARTGTDDKFDTAHPFFQAIRTLAALRTSHPGLSRGAMLVRPSGQPHLFAFSRIERAERVEYLVALSSSPTETVGATLETSQPPGAALRVLFDSQTGAPGAAGALYAGERGRVAVALAPLQCVVWQAEAPLPAPASGPTIAFGAPLPGSVFHFDARTIDGQTFPVRQELRAEVGGSDGCAEVTFVMARASRPGQYELLGTADAPPYRIFWRPPADLAPGETLSFIATVDDLRGHSASAGISGLTVAPSPLSFGIRGAAVPLITSEPGPRVDAAPGRDLELAVAATGTGPLEYRWLHDGAEIPGASGPALDLKAVSPAQAGHYRALVHDAEGTAVSRDIVVAVAR